MGTHLTTSDKVTYCSKCEIGYEGRLTECPTCANKAYLRVFDKSFDSIVLTEDNRYFLEKNCKTTFPPDVMCVVPSFVINNANIEEAILDSEKSNQRLIDAKKRLERKKEKEKKKKPAS